VGYPAEHRYRTSRNPSKHGDVLRQFQLAHVIGLLLITSSKNQNVIIDDTRASLLVYSLTIMGASQPYPLPYPGLKT